MHWESGSGRERCKGPGSLGSVLNRTFHSEFQYVREVCQIQDINLNVL